MAKHVTRSPVSRIITNAERDAILAAPKCIRVPLEEIMNINCMKNDGSGNFNRRFEVECGSLELRLVIRISVDRLGNYSILLFMFDGMDFRNLVRYDSWGHHESQLNPHPGITGEHKHLITEVAQIRGLSDCAYAEACDQYSNLDEAIRFALKDLNIDCIDDIHGGRTYG